MYEALVARVRYHIQKANFMGLKEAESTLLLGETADAIEELICEVATEHNERLDAEERQRWIPVTERLPKDAGVYLCRIKSFSHEFRYTDTMKYVDGFFYEQGAVTDRVTHWMPLPEPPKEEKIS